MKNNQKMGSQDKPLKEKRKLAAIMFTDIEGFTRMMAKDEPTTIRMLEEQICIMRDLINQHKGRLVKTMGDAVMADFQSAVNAVRCGVEIQKEIRKYNEDRLDTDKLLVRIGIHVGDVVVRGRDIYGDGVNLASRIEPLAEPGGICMSKHVYDKIRSFPDIITISLGLKELKNVDEPIEVHKVLVKGVMPAKVVQEAVAEQSESIVSIAVLPFVDMSPQKDQEYFCDGMAEELINALTKIDRLKVASRTSAFQCKGKGYDIHEIGEKLKVQTVFEGSVRKAGDRLRITAQLVNVADGYHLWSEKYDRDMEDIFAIQDEISLAIVDKLKVKLLREEKAKLVKRHTDDLEAYNLYLKGRYYLNKRTERGMKKGLEYFQQAIEKDPTYALPYTGIADCHNLLGWYDYLRPKETFPKAKVAAEKALAMDDTLAEAHTSLGAVREFYDWDWLAAEKEYKRAIELNPSYATAHHRYSEYLSYMGRHDESIAEAKRALELDPLSLIINVVVGEVFHFARQYDRAIEQLQKTLEMDPNFMVAHFYLAFPYAQKGMYNEAIAEVQKAMSLSGGDNPLIVAQLGTIYSYSGKRDEAKKILEELFELSKQRYVSPFYRALIYMGLDQKDQAFEWLEKAYEEHDHPLETLKVDPILDKLRSDPRFTALLKKMGFEK